MASNKHIKLKEAKASLEQALKIIDDPEYPDMAQLKAAANQALEAAKELQILVGYAIIERDGIKSISDQLPKHTGRIKNI